MNWLKTHEPDFWLLRIALFFMLVFPAFYSPFTDVYQSAYYAGFSWAYFFLNLSRFSILGFPSLSFSFAHLPINRAISSSDFPTNSSNNSTFPLNSFFSS